MEFFDLKRRVYECQGKFKTRQHIWHECISRILPGHVCLEFGVWHGTSINYFANARPDNKFHGFDSFEGLPQDWIKNHPAGTFRIEDKSKLKFAENVHLHEGWFQDSIPRFCASNPDPHAIKFIHMDCDLGSSADIIFDMLGDIIVNNKVMLLFDEFYGYLGFEDHEFRSFLKFIQHTGCDFEVIGRNVNHQQCLIQMK